MEQPTIQQRQTAYVVQIRDILSGIFVKEDGWNPNYISIGGKNVSRVNIIGAVIDNEENEGMQNITIDDSTGKIRIRNFEKKVEVNIGDIILLVGRIRQYNNEKYVTPEIIKKGINTKWSLVWKKFALNNEGIIQTEQKEVIEEKVSIANEEKSISEKILERIRELDDGSGTSYGDIIKEFKDEKILSNLLMQGEIFEIKPGKLKVLD